MKYEDIAEKRGKYRKLYSTISFGAFILFAFILVSTFFSYTQPEDTFSFEKPLLVLVWLFVGIGVIAFIVSRVLIPIYRKSEESERIKLYEKWYIFIRESCVVDGFVPKEILMMPFLKQDENIQEAFIEEYKWEGVLWYRITEGERWGKDRKLSKHALLFPRYAGNYFIVPNGPFGILKKWLNIEENYNLHPTRETDSYIVYGDGSVFNPDPVMQYMRNGCEIYGTEKGVVVYFDNIGSPMYSSVNQVFHTIRDKVLNGK